MIGAAPTRVHVEDVGVDAVVMCVDGDEMLVLRPGQSFDAAVAAIAKVYPGMHPDDVRRLVRQHLPHAQSFGELDRSDPAAMDLAGVIPPSRRRSPAFTVVTAGIAAAGAAALTATGLLLLGPSSAPSASTEDAVASLYERERFQAFSGASGMHCEALEPMVARCTDADGMVMLSEASVGPDSVAYVFSYGAERVSLRVFENADQAQAWGKEGGVLVLSNLAIHGRFALWGTDATRINAYLSLLVDQGPSATVASALPGRLQALALGTLSGAVPFDAARESDVAAVVAATDLVTGGGVRDELAALPGMDGARLQALDALLPGEVPMVAGPGSSPPPGPAGSVETPTPSAPTADAPADTTGRPAPEQTPVVTDEPSPVETSAPEPSPSASAPAPPSPTTSATGGSQNGQQGAPEPPPPTSEPEPSLGEVIENLLGDLLTQV